MTPSVPGSSPDTRLLPNSFNEHPAAKHSTNTSINTVHRFMSVSFIYDICPSAYLFFPTVLLLLFSPNVPLLTVPPFPPPPAFPLLSCKHKVSCKRYQAQTF